MKKEESKKHLRQRLTFYTVTLLCIVALGVAAWTAGGTDLLKFATASSDETASEEVENAVSESKKTYTDKDGETDRTTVTGKTVSGVPKTSSTASKTVSKNQTPSSSAEQKSAVSSVAEKSSSYQLPLTGEIIKKFSLTELQYSSTYEDSRVHTGIDIKGDEGAEVKSASDGTVSDVYEDKLYGTVVVIEHSENIKGFYCGLCDVTLASGDKVSAGSIIGKLTKIPCESADGLHLHFYMTRSDELIDPMTFLTSK